MSKFLFLVKISIFVQYFDFVAKFLFSFNTSILGQNFYFRSILRFWGKISIFGQNFYFFPTFRFFVKIQIFLQNVELLSKFRFLVKILICFDSHIWFILYNNGTVLFKNISFWSYTFRKFSIFFSKNQSFTFPSRIWSRTSNFQFFEFFRSFISAISASSPFHSPILIFLFSFAFLGISGSSQSSVRFFGFDRTPEICVQKSIIVWKIWRI